MTNLYLPSEQRLSKSIKDSIKMESIDYYCTIYSAVMECIFNQKTLKYSGNKLKEFPNISLRDIKGEFPNSFFLNQIDFLRNWALEFLLCKFLNQDFAEDLKKNLIEELCDIHQIDISEYINFEFKISGQDKAFYNKENFNEFTHQRSGSRAEHKKYQVHRNSDLCLLLHKDNKDQKPNLSSSLAIYGEVEGNYGNELLTEKYWEKKHQDCLFAIGCVDSRNIKIIEKTSLPHVFMYFPKIKGEYKVVLLIERNHYFIEDFSNALLVFDNFFNRGPKHYLDTLKYSISFHDEVVRYIASNWSKGIPELINSLNNVAIKNELITGENQFTPIEIPTGLNLISEIS
ncbi:hypothetical protein LZZ98_04835 [Acinetobacter sp. SM34]|uniref:hypothetical protein n=1 Tax=Acinetobacter sp. SM34 TaxID=1301620 RepID=UPI001EDBB6C9|nr:hypothetical protein [Acinetobacter sp. SM34]MCG2607863.1 hypothetical protein [Acinetobacter sp. SM34]